ncbi:SulP family inorganic anion transporter [Amaricoccus sp. W119]|uniref:SulP family inorganic anion transporter n=1 Tax=Amaricoccus sp. W119 TaxID=3391833 RepID=UPI0039A75D50
MSTALGLPAPLPAWSPRFLLRETLAGIVTALALVPEVISFSFISGVDPTSALVSSIVLCLVMSALGGRPAMVTAAAGSIALVVGPMVQAHGAGYILPTVLLAGAIQIAFGLAGLSRLMRFIPRSVMIGFVNALGILIFAAQVPHVIHGGWPVYALFALTVAIVLAAPSLTTAVPAPLIAIVAVTAIAVPAGLGVPSVGGDGSMAGLPGLSELLVPLNLDTFHIVWPSALSVAFVGLLETLLTAKLVDEITDTRSNKRRESWALGIANILAGLWGGIAGCAMIGQTIVNVKIGQARARLSTAVAGVAMLLLVTVLAEVMGAIPIVSLAAVMMIVAIRTVNWHSVAPRTLRRMPLPETAVMLSTVALTVATGNLAIGVGCGVLLAMVLFARRLAHVISVEREAGPDGQVRYIVRGPLFFGSSNDLYEHFAYAEDPERVSIDLTQSQIWDASSVASLDSIIERFNAHGTQVTLIGLDRRSSSFYSRLTGAL